MKCNHCGEKLENEDIEYGYCPYCRMKLDLPQEQVIHHSHHLPRCGKCGATVAVPEGSCQPCSNCGTPLKETCG